MSGAKKSYKNLKTTDYFNSLFRQHFNILVNTVVKFRMVIRPPKLKEIEPKRLTLRIAP